MPRTKRPAKKEERVPEDDETLKKLDKLVAEQKNMIDARCQAEIRNVELAFKILMGSIKPEYLQKTIGELKRELHQKELPLGHATGHSSRAASHDDGYLTQNSSQSSEDRGYKKKAQGIPVSTSRHASRRSRSAGPSSRKLLSQTACKTVQRRRSKSSVYRTPAYNKNAAVSYPAITPKVVPNAPMALLRQPRQGEMVVSMTGSPVMVPTGYNMQPSCGPSANCNILLRDGTMLSLKPEQMRQSQAYIPFSLMDDNVLKQLQTLKENIEKVVKLGEKVTK